MIAFFELKKYYTLRVIINKSILEFYHFQYLGEFNNKHLFQERNSVVALMLDYKDIADYSLENFLS